MLPLQHPCEVGVTTHFTDGETVLERVTFTRAEEQISSMGDLEVFVLTDQH